MKIIAITFAAALLSFVNAKQSVYDIAFKDIDGNKVEMESYKGKKMLITVIPVEEKDSAFARDLMNFYLLHKKEVNIIGILSEESGFTAEKISSVKLMLTRYGIAGILLTENMFTKKAAGNKQSKLLKWLTSKENNAHFDLDVKGVGQKFFVDENGNLYAVTGPQVQLGSAFINKVIARSVK